jgi:two-component system response regulator LytT
MIRIVMVEDEDMVIRRLTRFVGNLWAKQPHRIDAFSDFPEANDHLVKVGCDLLFLDLNLSGLDGFKLIQGTRYCGFETIVVSANTDRATEAFELGVLDFVAKPFSQERLELALSRFKIQQTRTLNRYLASKSSDGLKLTPLEEVIAIHGAGNYSEVETEAGERILHDRNLEQMAELLPETFVRVHRSHLVDWNRVVSIEIQSGSRYGLTLRNGRKIPVGRSKAAALKQKLLI